MAVYFEAAAVITVLVLLGQVLELRAREQTSGAITALLNLAPKPPDGWIATVMKRILMRKMSCSGDKLRIRPRESIPVDGIVIEGKTTVDESMVTGESMPVTKTKDDPVIGGRLIRQVVLSSVQRKSVMKRCSHELFRWSLMHSVRAPIQRMADSVSGWFVPLVILIAVVAFVIWLLGPGAGMAHGLIAAVSVLIIACPAHWGWPHRCR